MDCEELISLFNKVGGVLVCNYNKNIVTVKNTNLKCDILPKDFQKLEILTLEYILSPYDKRLLKNDKMTIEECISSTIKLKNKYLKNNEYGFEIKYLDS